MKISIYYKESELSNKIIEKINLLADEYNYSFDEINPDVVFCVGGDGTFLRAVQNYKSILDKITFIGIHSGHLGFFYDFALEDLDKVFKSLKDNTCSIGVYPLLKGELTYYDGTSKVLHAVNEIRIENPFHTLVSEVLIDNVRFETDLKIAEDLYFNCQI